MIQDELLLNLQLDLCFSSNQATWCTLSAKPPPHDKNIMLADNTD